MSTRSRLEAYVDENRNAIEAGTIVNAIFYLPALGFAFTIVFAGAIGGWIAGSLTPRYGPSLRNGAVAGALGAAIPTAIALLLGLAIRIVVGPNPVYVIGMQALYAAPLFVPLFAIEGAVGGIAASWFAKTR